MGCFKRRFSEEDFYNQKQNSSLSTKRISQSETDSKPDQQIEEKMPLSGEANSSTKPVDTEKGLE